MRYGISGASSTVEHNSDPLGREHRQLDSVNNKGRVLRELLAAEEARPSTSLLARKRPLHDGFEMIVRVPLKAAQTVEDRSHRLSSCIA